MTETFRTERDGFAACGLRSQEMELVVVPALGACVVSLRSVRTGREWMWTRPDSVGLFANTPGDPFERSPLTGAVECLPTIAPCTVAGIALPDHGEAWQSAWTLNEAAWEQKRIETSLSLPASGLEFSRSITLDGPSAHCAYRLRNPLGRAAPYLWAFHPLLVFERGSRVELPSAIRQVCIGARHGLPALDGQTVCNWPEPAPGIRLDTLMASASGAAFVKLFADFSHTHAAWAALRRCDERLEFLFDGREISSLGLWFTDGGWNGFRHLAIEPTNAMTDSLLESPGNLMEPLAERTWSFQIVLTQGKEIDDD